MNNIWRDFAKLNGMTSTEFSNEIIITAQAVLAMKLTEKGEAGIRIKSSQDDGDYELIFKKVSEQ